MNTFAVNLANCTQQTTVSIVAKLAEKVFENCVEQRPFASMERMFVLFWQLGNLIAAHLHELIAAADVAL